MQKQLLWAAAVMFAAHGLARASDGACPTAEPDCCGKKVCCPTTKTWARPRTEFNVVKEDFCVPPCCWFGGLFKGKSCGCEPGCCGKVRTRKVLVIKVRKEEHCLPDCKPGYAPIVTHCDAASCPPPCEQAPRVSLPQGAPVTVTPCPDGMASPAAIPGAK
jgi:hypothetical protein